MHCVKSAQVQSFFWPVLSRIQTEYGDLQSKYLYSDLHGSNMGKYGPEKSPYLDTFHTVMLQAKNLKILGICPVNIKKLQIVQIS